MATYLVLKPVAFSVDEHTVCTVHAGAVIDSPFDDDETAELVAAGRLQPVEPDVELVDEPAEGEKPLKSYTNAELVEVAKANGASEDSVKNLTKPQLLEAIERLTHTSGD